MKFKITGTCASMGTVKAKALVIKNPLSLPKQPTYPYIIVAKFTTPLFNTLLLKAKGIVCETGGVTTHAAIISRELGIPCIMSAFGAVNKIKNSQIVEINSKNSSVTIYA